MVKITLDAETFKALASTTRLTVLRALDQRRKTLTELSRDLDLNKATVHEHLQLLTAADLIRKRDDEGRKWIYYELTWRGQRLMHPQETTTFNVLLGLSVAAAGGGVTMLGRALGWWLDAHPVPQPASDPTVGGVDVGDADTRAYFAQPAAATGTTTAASGAPPSGSGGGTSSDGPPPAASPPQSSAPAPHDEAALADSDGNATALEAAQSSGAAAEQGDPGFLDEGGMISLVLLCMTALFVGLAFLLRREIRPKRFNRQAAQAAETAAPETAPGLAPPSRKP